MQSGTVSQPHTDAHAHMHMHVLHKDVNTSTGAQCIYTCTWSCQSHQQPAESAPNHRLDQPDHAYMMYIDRWDRPCSRDTGCHTVYTCIYIHIRTGQLWDGTCMVYMGYNVSSIAAIFIQHIRVAILIIASRMYTR